MSLAPFLVHSKSGSSKSKHSNVAILFYTVYRSACFEKLMDLRGTGRRKGGNEERRKSKKIFVRFKLRNICK
jgi:hypothetical protein